jgi:hypothetical protein
MDTINLFPDPIVDAVMIIVFAALERIFLKPKLVLQSNATGIFVSAFV